MINIVSKLLTVFRQLKDAIGDHELPVKSKDNQKVYILTALILGCVVFFLMNRKTPLVSYVPPNDTLATQVTVQPKSKQTDADLTVSNQFVAVVNGKTVKIPVSNSQDSKGNQMSVVQTIDLTNLTRSLRPSWEFGGGYAHINGKHYMPLSVQRNYGTNKALSLTVFVGNGNDDKNWMVEHRWLIR